MTEDFPPDVSLEQISAFLAGEASPKERARIEQLLATSEETRELVREILALEAMESDDQRESSSDDDPAPVPRRRFPGRVAIPLLAAASVAVLYLAGRTDTSSAQSVLDRLGDVPAESIADPPWSPTRGVDTETELDARASFRIGVRWLGLLVATGSPELAAQLRTELEDLLAGRPRSAPAVQLLRDFPTDRPPSPAQVAELELAILASVDSDRFRVGLLLEGLRISRNAERLDALASGDLAQSVRSATDALPPGVVSAIDFVLDPTAPAEARRDSTRILIELLGG